MAVTGVLDAVPWANEGTIVETIFACYSLAFGFDGREVFGEYKCVNISIKIIVEKRSICWVGSNF